MPTTCGFPNCRFRSRYRGSEDNRHFYRVPKKPAILRKRWLEAIGRTEETIVSQLRVCSGHFYGGEKHEGDIPVADPSIDEQIRIELPPKTPRTVQTTNSTDITGRYCYNRRGGRGRSLNSTLRNKTHLVKHGLINSFTRSNICNSIRNRTLNELTGQISYKNYFNEVYNRQYFPNTTTNNNNPSESTRDNSGPKSLSLSWFDRINSKVYDPSRYPLAGYNFPMGPKISRPEFSGKTEKPYLDTTPISNLRTMNNISEDYTNPSANNLKPTYMSDTIKCNPLSPNSKSSTTSAFLPLGRNSTPLFDETDKVQFLKSHSNDVGDFLTLNGLPQDYILSFTSAIHNMLCHKLDIPNYDQLVQRFLTFGPLKSDDRIKSGCSQTTNMFDKLTSPSTVASGSSTSSSLSFMDDKMSFISNPSSGNLETPSGHHSVSPNKYVHLPIRNDIIPVGLNQSVDRWMPLDQTNHMSMESDATGMDLRLIKNFQLDPRSDGLLSRMTEHSHAVKPKSNQMSHWIGQNKENPSLNRVQSCSRSNSQQLLDHQLDVGSSKLDAICHNTITAVVGISDLDVETPILGSLTNLMPVQIDQLNHLPEYVSKNIQNIIVWNPTSELFETLHKFHRLTNLFLFKGIDCGLKYQKLIPSVVKIHPIPHSLDVETTAEYIIAQILSINLNKILTNSLQNGTKVGQRPSSAPENFCLSVPSGNLSRVSEFKPYSKESPKSMKGLHIGLVGMCAINLAIIQRLKPFGCHFLIYEPNMEDGLNAALGIKLSTSLQQLLQQSDWLIIVRPDEALPNQIVSNLNTMKTKQYTNPDIGAHKQAHILLPSQQLENLKRGMNLIYLDVNRPDLVDFPILMDLVQKNLICNAIVISDHNISNILPSSNCSKLIWISNVLNSLKVKSKELRYSASNYIKKVLLNQYKESHTPWAVLNSPWQSDMSYFRSLCKSTNDDRLSRSDKGLDTTRLENVSLKIPMPNTENTEFVTKQSNFCIKSLVSSESILPSVNQTPNLI